MDTATSSCPVFLTRTGLFRRDLIASAVPEMMGLAYDTLEQFETVEALPSEVTPAAVVAMVLEDVLPLLDPEVGLSWGAITLQCALLDLLAELTEWELDKPPIPAALAS